jgi:hypothetical protein
VCVASRRARSLSLSPSLLLSPSLARVLSLPAALSISFGTHLPADVTADPSSRQPTYKLDLS